MQHPQHVCPPLQSPPSSTQGGGVVEVLVEVVEVVVEVVDVVVEVVDVVVEVVEVVDDVDVGTQVVPWQLPAVPLAVTQLVPGSTTEVTQPPSRQVTVRQTFGAGQSFSDEHAQ